MKKVLTLLIAVLLVFSFAACSSSSKFDNGYYDYATNEFAEEPETYYSEEAFDSAAGESTSLAETQLPGGRKLIRRFELDVETLEFDAFVSSVKQKVAEYGGYIESSSVSGNSYNYSYGMRDASFVCRVPSEKLDAFVNTVGGLGNVTYCYEDSEDVTLNYVDVEARVASLQTEYDRLLELLAEAENIDSIIILEQRLSEVRYQLESYKSQLRTYDNLIDYSTVNLTVREVKRITEAESESVWERISNDFGDNVYDIWIGLQDFFVWFVGNIPYFIIWAVIIVIIVLIVKLFLRKNPRYRAKKAYRKAEKERRKAEKLARKNGEAPPAEAPKDEENK